MRITKTGGNHRNGITGCRITVTTSRGEVVDRIITPSKPRDVGKYMKKYAVTDFGKRYRVAVNTCLGIESAYKDIPDVRRVFTWGSTRKLMPS